MPHTTDMQSKNGITAQMITDAIIDAARQYHSLGLELFELLYSHRSFDVNMQGLEEQIAQVAKGGPLRRVRKDGAKIEMVSVGKMVLKLAGHSATLHGKGSFHFNRLSGKHLPGGLIDFLNRKRISPYSGFHLYKFTGLSFAGPLGPLVGGVFVFKRNGVVWACPRIAGIWMLPPDF